MKMKYYRYVSIGLSLSGKAGKVSYLHEKCGIAFNEILGPDAEKMEGTPPKDAVCPYCGKDFSGSNTEA